MKKFLSLILSIVLVFAFASCSNSQNGAETTTSAPTTTGVGSIIKNATLQYPKSNSLFKYNVYDTYVEITEYIGSDTAAEVTVPAKLENLPVYVVSHSVFEKCKVKSIIFEEGIYKINTKFSFYLEKVVLPSTLDFIGYGTFESCSKLKTVVIPEGIDSIQGTTFMHCSSLKEITIPSTVKIISNETFAFCSSLEKVVLKSGLTEIGEKSFVGCTSLKSIELPQTLETIKSSAFQGTGLVEITIPKSVKKVEGGLFTACEDLKKVTVLNENMEIEKVSSNMYDLLFSQCRSDLVIYGKPGSSIAKVAAAENIYFEVIK